MPILVDHAAQQIAAASRVDRGAPRTAARRLTGGISPRGGAHLATVLPDGAPHSVPVWAGTDGDHVAILTGPGSRKEIVDRIAVKYTGGPYRRDQERVVALIEPDRQIAGVR